MSPRLRAYVVATVLAAAGVMAFVRPQDLAHTWGHLVAWAAMCVVSERLSTRTESGATWSLAATVGLASAVVWGIGAGVWVSALSTLVADVAVHRKPAVRVAFNTSQIALATDSRSVTLLRDLTLLDTKLLDQTMLRSSSSSKI